MKNKTQNKQNKKFAKGFTLLELLVVVVIIGVLAAIALPQYKMAVLKSKYARAKQTASDIRKAYELYYTVHNTFPTKFSQLDFANKFNDSNQINTGDYNCGINANYNELYCIVKNKLSYLVNFYTNVPNRIITQCRTATTDTSDIYNKLCQQETGKTAAQANCSSGLYCYYIY